MVKKVKRINDKRSIVSSRRDVVVQDCVR